MEFAVFSDRLKNLDAGGDFTRLLYQRNVLIMYMTAPDPKTANAQLDRFLDKESIVAIFAEASFLADGEWGAKLATRLSKAAFPVYFLADDPSLFAPPLGLVHKRTIRFPGPIPGEGLASLADCVAEEVARRRK